MSRQDGAILPARDFSLGPARSKIIFCCFIRYNKSFNDQACSVKMAGYWPRSFFCVFMDLDHKHANKITWPISTHLDRTSLVNSPCPPWSKTPNNPLSPCVRDQHVTRCKTCTLTAENSSDQRNTIGIVWRNAPLCKIFSR